MSNLGDRSRRHFLRHSDYRDGFSPVLWRACLGWPIWTLQAETGDPRTFGKGLGALIPIMRYRPVAS